MINTLEWIDNKLKIIDQTKLPLELTFMELETKEQVHDAISRLCVRGAPAIGVAAAYGVVIGMKNTTSKNYDQYLSDLQEVCFYLASSRPTAVNLFWALEKIQQVILNTKNDNVVELNKILLTEAHRIYQEDLEMGKKIGEHGEKLIKDGDTLLTHCNAGGLATSGYGTALAPMFTAQNKGKKIKVYADETRPLLQGSRLTVWELMNENIDVTLICDNMAGFVMKQGKINKVIVGADRIASNGDAANKIGTYTVAVLAKRHNVPFYIAAPKSTFDLSLQSGAEIPIEERSSKEITCGFGKWTAPKETKTYSPAFDVTDNELISGFITEEGIIYPPFSENIAKMIKN